MEGKINVEEIASNTAQVTMTILHEATERAGTPIFPNGLTKLNNKGELEYTQEAQNKYKELYDIYWDIVDESNI